MFFRVFFFVIIIFTLVFGEWVKVRDIFFFKFVIIFSINKYVVFWEIEMYEIILKIIYCFICRYYSYIILCLCFFYGKNIKSCSWRVIKIVLGLI